MGRVTTREAVLKLGRGADGTDGSMRSRDTLVAEEPLEIRVAGRQIAVTMRTPGDDFDLVAGYLVGEGVIRSPEQLTRMRFCGDTACSGPVGLTPQPAVSRIDHGSLTPEPAGPKTEPIDLAASPVALPNEPAASPVALPNEPVVEPVEPVVGPATHATEPGFPGLPRLPKPEPAPFLVSGPHQRAELSPAPELYPTPEPLLPPDPLPMAEAFPIFPGHGATTHGRVESAHDAYNIIDVDLAPGTALPLWSLARTTYTTSACGVCGKSSIEAVRANAHWSVERDPVRISPQVLYSLPKTLRAGQKLFAKTGGLHAAGLFTSEGELVCIREDVGRHNAVDKVIGWAVRANRLPLREHLLAVSGRASFELVQKAAAAGIPVLAAVSAPSALAVELARASGMTLAGFVRGESANVYAGAERINLAVADPAH